MVTVDVGFGGGFGLVTDDVLGVKGVAFHCLEFNLNIVLFSYCSVNFISLDISLLDCLFKFIWKIYTGNLKEFHIAIAFQQKGSCQIVSHFVIDSVS